MNRCTAIGSFLGEDPELGYLFILETRPMLSRLALNFASVLSNGWHRNRCHCTSRHIVAGMVGVVIVTPSRTAVLQD